MTIIERRRNLCPQFVFFKRQFDLEHFSRNKSVSVKLAFNNTALVIVLWPQLQIIQRLICLKFVSDNSFDNYFHDFV